MIIVTATMFAASDRMICTLSEKGTTAAIKYFEQSDLEKAREWLRE